MRVLIVGAGLAGALLAERLHAHGIDVQLVASGGTDATAVSGGLVRAFEPDPTAGALARQAPAELYADPSLRSVTRYRETGSVYLLPAAALPAADPPPGAGVLDAAEVRRRFAFAGLAADTVGVHERQAGFLSPDRLRHAVLARLRAAGVVPEQATVTLVEPGGALRLASGRWLRGGTVVLATGAGTPDLLRSSGLAREPAVVRTKHIQVGRPDDPGGLALRPLGPGLWTFTGGGGAAAKIALSASRVAAAELGRTCTVHGGTT